MLLLNSITYVQNTKLFELILCLLSFPRSATLLGRLSLFFHRRLATLSCCRFLFPIQSLTLTQILCFFLQVLLLPLFICSLPTICTESYALKEKNFIKRPVNRDFIKFEQGPSFYKVLFYLLYLALSGKPADVPDPQNLHYLIS